MIAFGPKGWSSNRTPTPLPDVGQSRRGSMIETLVQLVSGMIISLLLQLYFFPKLGWNPPLSINLLIMVLFAVASFVRGYVIRRIFNFFRN